MKNIKNFLSFTVVLFVMTLLLASCGSKAPATLEEYINLNPDTAEEINDTASTAGLNVSVKENEVSFTYDIKDIEGITKEIALSDEMKSSLDKALGDNASTFSSMCSTLEKESDIEGISIVVTYSYDGETIVTNTYTADTDSGDND